MMKECNDICFFCFSSDDDSDDDGECPFGNPLLRDSYGNLTNWRLSDLDAAFTKHLEDEAKNPKPKERKYTKEERLKIHRDRMEGYIKFALHQYNSENKLVGVCVQFYCSLSFCV
jgi:hypothetical protein